MIATAAACSGGVGIFDTSGYGPGPILLSTRIEGIIVNQRSALLGATRCLSVLFLPTSVQTSLKRLFKGLMENESNCKGS